MFWLMNRLVNPLVRLILRSPAHRLLSGSLLVLTYCGRKTGRRHSLPVMYAERDGELVVFAGQSDKKRWWRNLIEPAPVSIVLRGRTFSGVALAILDDDVAIRQAWDAYVSRFPASAKSQHPGDAAVFVRLVPGDIHGRRSSESVA